MLAFSHLCAQGNIIIESNVYEEKFYVIILNHFTCLTLTDL